MRGLEASCFQVQKRWHHQKLRAEPDARCQLSGLCGLDKSSVLGMVGPKA